MNKHDGHSFEDGRGADELLDRLLNSEVSPEELAALEAQAERTGDLLLLDALLWRAVDPGREAALREARVGRAMAAVRHGGAEPIAVQHAGRERGQDEGGETDRRHRRRLRVVVLSGARWLGTIGLLLLVTILWVGPTSQSDASAALDDAIAASERDIDRTYRVVTQYTGRDGGKREKESTLNVRGSDRFLVKTKARSGSEFLIGSDSEEMWVVAGGRLVQVHQRGEVVEPWLQVVDISMSFFDIRSALVELKERYRLEVTSSRSERRVTRIRGTLAREEGIGPEVVEVSIGRGGEVERLVLEWTGEGRRDRKSTFELVSSDELPDSLYEHATHH